MTTRTSTAKTLAVPLAAGLALRELLAPWTGHPFDFEIWVRLGYFIQSGGGPYSLLPYVNGLSFAPYPLMTSISYPPFSALMFGLTYWLYALLGSPSQFLYYFLLKQPMVLADLATGVVLFKLVALGRGEEEARKMASLWLYFPFAIVVSAVWGALDPLALFLILASLYAFKTEKSYESALLLGLAIYLKLMPVIFLPVFLLQSSLTARSKLSYAAIALSIPILGTLVPDLVGGWGFSGMYYAVSYQGDLSAFGGMSIFLPLSLTSPLPGPLTQLLGLVWVPSLLLGYLYIRRSKLDLTTGLLVTVLVFSVSRVALPEQWALYPLAFLIIGYDAKDRKHFLAIAAVASTFLVVNNFLLVRFFVPVSQGAFAWDQYVDNASVVAEARYAIMIAAGIFFFAEALSIIARKESILSRKVIAARSLSARSLALPSVYLSTVTITGGLLDFTVIGLVSDWALPIQSHSFLGFSPLSLYHIMLVIVFETSAVVLVLFGRRSLQDSVDLLLLLTSLNVAASGLALVLFRLLDGTPAFADIPIYLAGSTLVTERFFIVFTLAFCLLGLLFRKEITQGLLLIPRRIGLTAPESGRQQ